MRRLVPAALAAIALAAAPSAPVHAWGFAGHRFITDRAIALLPAEIRPFFEASRTALVEHSIDPDTYRLVGFAEEGPRHFLDMDAYGPFPFTGLPHDYDAAVAARGAEFVTHNGTLPWRLQEIYDKLRDAFKDLPTAPFAREDVKLFSSVAAHYVEDACQPLHAARNYDGQLTGQNGIHARFESELFERYRGRLRIAPGPVVPVPSAREFAFATLASSFQQVAPLLEADRAAAAGRQAYDDAYFEALFARARPILEARISQAITGTASIITAAWIEAGKPALPATPPRRAPRVIKRAAR